MVRAAVIGSGFGGIASSIRLQALGFDTHLYEKRDKPGGRAYVYKEQGFTFDAGPTVITAPQCLDELFTLSGRKMNDYVDLRPLHPFYRLCWEDGSTFDYSNSDQELFSQIARRSPNDVEGYKKFMVYSKEVYKEGYEKLVAEPFLNWGSMLKAAPQLIRLSAYRSVYSMVSKFVKDPQLRQAFSFHSLLIGGNPFSSSAIYTLIHHLEKTGGVYFAMGGTNALVNGLIKLFSDLGGTLHLNSPVEAIETDTSNIRGLKIKNQPFEKFDVVVSNADAVHTYKHLLSNEQQTRFKAKRLEKMRHSMSLFVVYFGTRKKYPQLAHHSILFGSRYKDLLREIFNDGTLADDFSLYLHAPCRTDPSLAPPNCESFYVLSPVPHLGKGKIDWTKEAEPYADRILNYLEERYMPGLKENLVLKKIFSPLDFKDELNSHWGSAFSLEPILTQSAYFRLHNKDAHLKGLYFAGAGTHPGAGIPGVVNSAKATVGLIKKDYAHSSHH